MGLVHFLIILHAGWGLGTRLFIFVDSIFVSTQRAWNVLHHACIGGSVEVLKWLIETFPGLDTDDFLNAKTMVGKISCLIVICCDA